MTRDEVAEVEEIYFNAHEGEYGAIICCFGGRTPTEEEVEEIIKEIQKVV